MTDIGTSYASLDGAATTIIVVAEEDRKKYGLKEQGAVGSITTATFKTLKGTRAFIHDRFPPFLPSPDRKSTRLNSSHIQKSRMPSSA